MANFSPFNNFSFPSPASTRGGFNQPIPVSGTGNNRSISACSSSIQFPSPVYVTSTQGLAMKVEPSKPRSYLLPSIYGNRMESTLGDKFMQGNISGAEAILGNGWQSNIPSTMPWAVTGTGHNTVQFTAASPISQSPFISRLAKVHNIHSRRLKRRVAHSSIDDRPDSKVFINEDRVAESMRNLQLSGNSSTVIDPNQAWYTTQIVGDDTTTEMDQEASGLPSIKLSRELEAGLAKKDIVTQLIQEEMSKSCKQIVLWTPPPGGQIRELLAGSASPVKRSMDVIDMGLQSPKKMPKSPSATTISANQSPSSKPMGQDPCQSSMSMETVSANGLEASQLNTPTQQNGRYSSLQGSENNSLDSFNFFSNNNNVQSQNSIQQDLMQQQQRTSFSHAVHLRGAASENGFQSSQGQLSQGHQMSRTGTGPSIPVYSRRTLTGASLASSESTKFAIHDSMSLDLMDDEDLDL